MGTLELYKGNHKLNARLFLFIFLTRLLSFLESRYFAQYNIEHFFVFAFYDMS